MNKLYTIISLLAFTFTIGCGSSSPTTPAQIPTTVDYASVSIEMGTTSTVSQDIGDSSSAAKSSDDEPQPSVNVTCAAGRDSDAVCFDSVGFIANIMKVEIGKCVDAQGNGIVCTFSLNDYGNIVATNPDGSDPTWVIVWDVLTTTETNLSGSGSTMMYTVDLSDTVQELPGTEQLTSGGVFSAVRYKLVNWSQQWPTDAQLGSISGVWMEQCGLDGGCLIGSDLIASAINGDLLKIDGSDYYWYDDTAKEWVTTRPSNPYVQQQPDPAVYDSSDGCFRPILKIDNDSNGTADTITIEVGKSYQLTFTYDIRNTLYFIDNQTDDDVYTDGEQFITNGPSTGITAAED